MKELRKLHLLACIVLLSACTTQPFAGEKATTDLVYKQVDAKTTKEYVFAEEFIQSVRRGDITSVQRFIAEDAPVNFLDKNGVHLAIHAVQSNNPQLVDYLATKGMDLNGYGKATYTPIFLAVSKTPEMIDVLVKHKVDLDAVSKYSSNYAPAISWGIRKRKTENVAKLINSGADVNALDSFGVPPILYAFNQQNITIMKLIFSHGGDPNYVDSDGNSLVTASIRMGNLNLLKALAEANADLTARDGSGKTPLSLAITVGNSQIVEFLKKQLGIT